MKTFDHPAVDDIAIERLFEALSDPVRLGIVRQLAREGEASCGALEQGRPKSTMSHHFKVLRASGLVWTYNDGRIHVNALRRDEIEKRFPGLLAVALGHPAPAGS